LRHARDIDSPTSSCYVVCAREGTPLTTGDKSLSRFSLFGGWGFSICASLASPGLSGTGQFDHPTCPGIGRWPGPFLTGASPSATRLYLATLDGTSLPRIRVTAQKQTPTPISPSVRLSNGCGKGG
jgi:hypothetical protein